MTKICFFLHQVGPYHHARFQDLAKHADLSVIEIRPNSDEYDWLTKFDNAFYKRHKINPQGKIRGIFRLLDIIKPDLVVNVGWADIEYYVSILWCKLNGVKVSGVSDSTYHDSRRFWILELLKSQIVGLYDQMLVAGKRSREYLKKLGYPMSKTLQPWDVVDNDFYKKNSNNEKSNSKIRAKYKLPSKFFLCVSRYIPKKNHLVLLDSFHSFVNRHSEYQLVFIGSGYLRDKIDEKILELGLTNVVHVFDFIHQEDISSFYSMASAVILASQIDQWGLVVNEAIASGTPVICSIKCGCVDDLIPDETYGFRCEPTKEGLLEAMEELQNTSPKEVESKVRKSKNNLENNFGLEQFSNALIKLAEI